MKRICVFCGSSEGAYPIYKQTAVALGQLLAQNEINLVYGGATVGTMGAVADAVMEAGGKVYGVIPRGLFGREVPHHNITQLDIVDSMHERKARMAELSDGFISLPGGIGTFEEMFEVLSWAQLGIHQKPVGLLNVEGFYDKLLDFLDDAVSSGFVKSTHRELLVVKNDPASLLEALQTFQPPLVSKWMGEEEI